MRRCPQSGGDSDAGEAGPRDFGGNASGNAPALWEASGNTWQTQDGQAGHDEQNDLNGDGHKTYDKPFDEQELSDKLAQVSWESNAGNQEPQYGW